MKETITYIQNKLKDTYPPEEIQSFIRLIMEHVCHLQFYQLLTDKDKEISNSQKKEIYDITERLLRYEPIQYILGNAYFYGLRFTVNKHTLIPRPETEELVDHIIRENQPDNKDITILDIGTGSGCIAVTLAKYLPRSTVFALDISSEALKVAERNAKQLNTTRISFICADILSPDSFELQDNSVDMIVSNPPYVMEKEKAVMQKNVLDYEPDTALFVPDNNSLLFYTAIARLGKTKLRKGGSIYFEINAQCHVEMLEMMKKEGYRDIELMKDLPGKDRFLKAIRS